MAEEIRFPRLGWSMEEGRFIQWLKRDGDLVREGEVLFEMEGEKALQEIESVANGILKIAVDAPQPGDVVQVGHLLGYLLLPNELAPNVAPELPVDANVSAGDSVTIHLQVEPPESESLPQVVEENELSAAVASPRARRLAGELGIDWQSVDGTGRDGRVREEDIRRVAADGPSKSVPSLPSGKNRFTPRRKMIAERLRKSRELTVPVTLTTKVDVSRLVTYRELQKKMQSVRVPAFTDLFAKHVALVLARHPAMAVRWNHDHTELLEISNQSLHIGIAVDTEDGLLVPVVKNVFSKTIEDIVMESKTLIEKARAGRLSSHEMSDGVISISNLGAYGIDAFTPIINVPEIAILGLGAIRREPIFDKLGQVQDCQRMVLSLTFDHAAVDGAPAASFLHDLVKEIETT